MGLTVSPVAWISSMGRETSLELKPGESSCGAEGMRTDLPLSSFRILTVSDGSVADSGDMTEHRSEVQLI